MQRKPLESTQRRGQKSKSQPIRQTSSGNKHLKITTRGQQLKNAASSKEKKEPMLRVSQSPKYKKPQQKVLKKQLKANTKMSRQSSNSKQKQKVKTKIISFKTQQSDISQDQALKKSTVDISVPLDIDSIDDDINLLSISNYPLQNGNDFLRETHITGNMSKKEYIKQKEQLKKSNRNKEKTNSKNRDKLTKSNRKQSSSEKQKLQVSVKKAELLTSHRNLQKTNNGIKKSTRGIEKSSKGLSKTKRGTKEKSSSNDTKKGTSAKKDMKPMVPKTGKSPIPANLPKSIPKPSKSKKKQPTKFAPTNTLVKRQQQSSSDTTNAPTFQQLEKLRQQNQKYKLFLASSAFKVQQLKRQIQQSKQIRQNQRSLYSFQLNNLKKQLDANKKYLGHLYSYDDPSSNPNGFLPDQIIIQTDNESSSIKDSINVLSKMSKQLGLEDFSQSASNKIRGSAQSMGLINKSNPSSSNDNDGESKLVKSQLNKVPKDQLLKDDGSKLGFLEDIKKIPSLQIRLSFDQDTGKDNQGKLNDNRLNPNIFLRNQKHSSSPGNEDGSALLLLNSFGK